MEKRLNQSVNDTGLSKRSRNALLGLLALVLMVGLAACLNLPGLGPAEEEEPVPTETPLPPPTEELPPPTDLPAATQEPEPAAEAVPPIVRMTTLINVRTGPSINCPIIGSYPQDSQVEVRAQTMQRDWWRVPYANTEGWIFAEYTAPVTDVSQVPLEPAQGCAAPSTGGSSASATPLPPTATVMGPTATTMGPTATPMPPTATLQPSVTPTWGGIIIVTLFPLFPTPTPTLGFLWPLPVTIDPTLPIIGP